MRGRYLYSHLPYADALARARSQPGQSVDEPTFKAWWADSQEAKAQREAAWAAPVERDLPPGCETYVAEVMAIPQVALVGPRPWAVRVIDLRRVVGYQVNVIEERIVIPKDLDPKDPCALLRLSLRKPAPVPFARQESLTEFTISSTDINLQVLGSAGGDERLGRVFGFIIGAGLPWIQVVAFEGRHILRDGYHRAVGLLRAGVFEVPVARIVGADVGDLGIKPGFLPADLVLGPQPPLLTDFLDDRLSRDDAVRNIVKTIRITAEQFVVPVPEPGDPGPKSGTP